MAAEQSSLFENLKPERNREARSRAKAIVGLYGIIDDAPEQQEIMRSQMRTCQYFIDKGSAGTMSLDDWDGMFREIGDLQDCIDYTDEDRAAIASDAEHWQPILPVGYGGARAGDVYYTALHPKEVALLVEWNEEMQLKVDGLAEVLKDAERELAQLCAVGPLPVSIAKHYHLTTDCKKLPAPGQ